MCNEAVRERGGGGGGDRSKLKWWYKVNELNTERYCRLVLYIRHGVGSEAM